jgi:hypothetical protein
VPTAEFTPTLYVRVRAIGDIGLSAEQVRDTLALAVTELAKVTAYMLNYGPAEGWRLYLARGGCARADASLSPWVPVTPPGFRTNEGRCPGPGGCFEGEPCGYAADMCAPR